MKLFPGADDELLEQLQQLCDVTETDIAELPVKPEMRALDDVREVASRIVVHESSDCWHDAYVLLSIAGKLYRLLVEFKPCFPIKSLDWLSNVVSGLLWVKVQTKDQVRILGPDFHGVLHAVRPDAASMLVSTGSVLLLVKRETLALSFGGMAALANNFLRLYDARKAWPDITWLTTPEPFNYLVVDDGGAAVYLLVFDARGAFVESRVYEPVRHSKGVIVSLGGVRRRIKTLQDTATDAGLKHPVLLGCEVKQVILSEDASSVVFIGTIDDTLDDKIEAKFARFGPPPNSSFLAPNDFWTSALSKAVRNAWAAETPTPEQQEILDAQLKVIDTINGSAPGMAGADARATKVAASSLKATFAWYVAHPFDASDVRGSGHDATHVMTYMWLHACNNRDEAKRKLAEAGVIAA